jgi:hypothetical protein
MRGDGGRLFFMRLPQLMAGGKPQDVFLLIDKKQAEI